MTWTLIIAEKPAAAAKIAAALDGSGKPVKKKVAKQGEYFEINFAGGSDHGIVVSAVGHLYNLTPSPSVKGYPVYDFNWKAGGAKYTWKYINTIKTVMGIQPFDRYVVATDYDLEGSVIGYNVLRFLCAGSTPLLKGLLQKSDRMRFSTLTPSDLRAAWAAMGNGLDCERIEAGYARHWVDILFGINLSRALMASIKSAGRYAILSIGRVQGPTLKAVQERELAIQQHVPDPYWTLHVPATWQGTSLELESTPTTFQSEALARLVKQQCENSHGIVAKVESVARERKAPLPFNLSGLQREANKVFNMKPSRTLAIAEKLYLAALISYPRTESEIIPPSIDTKAILQGISSQSPYQKPASALLSLGPPAPSKGTKKDDAHPPILPSGKGPGAALTGEEKKLYDLIVKRFLAIHGSPLKWEERQHFIAVQGHSFKYLSSSLDDAGWTTVYQPYHDISAHERGHQLSAGDRVDVGTISINHKFTKPPPRYSDMTLIKYMEREDIGTKSTRAAIIDKLKDRGYITGGQIAITDMGREIINVFNNFLPEVVSVSLTRKLEGYIEDIEKGKETLDIVRRNTKATLDPMLARFKQQQNTVGTQLAAVVQTATVKKTAIGTCPACKKTLLLVSGKKKRFVACEGYLDKKKCSVSLPIVQSGRVFPANKSCPACGYPVVKVYKQKGRPPWSFCLNWSKCPASAKSQKP